MATLAARRALLRILGTELPIIQAPMAGVQVGALAVAVSDVGGLGSLPCAMLTVETMRKELAAIRAATSKPYNVNFFCHTQPPPSVECEATWRKLLAPYFREYGIDADSIPAGPGRAPFTAELADALEEFAPRVVSFHFGLPSPALVARVKSWGSKILASATTVDEAGWLEANGADAVIAQGADAGGHRGTRSRVDSSRVRRRTSSRRDPGDRRARALRASSARCACCSSSRAVSARRPRCRGRAAS